MVSQDIDLGLDEFSLILCVEGRAMWSAHEFERHTGIMYFAERPWQSSEEPIPFRWRGRGRGEGHPTIRIRRQQLGTGPIAPGDRAVDVPAPGSPRRPGGADAGAFQRHIAMILSHVVKPPAAGKGGGTGENYETSEPVVKWA